MDRRRGQQRARVPLIPLGMGAGDRLWIGIGMEVESVNQVRFNQRIGAKLEGLRYQSAPHPDRPCPSMRRRDCFVVRRSRTPSQEWRGIGPGRLRAVGLLGRWCRDCDGLRGNWDRGRWLFIGVDGLVETSKFLKDVSKRVPGDVLVGIERKGTPEDGFGFRALVVKQQRHAQFGVDLRRIIFQRDRMPKRGNRVRSIVPPDEVSAQRQPVSERNWVGWTGLLVFGDREVELIGFAERVGQIGPMLGSRGSRATACRNATTASSFRPASGQRETQVAVERRGPGDEGDGALD